MRTPVGGNDPGIVDHFGFNGDVSGSLRNLQIAVVAGGKQGRQKDLALLAMSYGNVYVANVAMGADDMQTLKAFLEAERYPGPSLVIAYSHCIAHGYDMVHGLEQQKAAALSGAWPLFSQVQMGCV